MNSDLPSESTLNRLCLDPEVASNIVHNIRGWIKENNPVIGYVPFDIYSNDEIIIAWHKTYLIKPEDGQCDYDLITDYLNGNLIVK